VATYDFGLTDRNTLSPMNTAVLHDAIRAKKPQIEPIKTQATEGPNRPYRLRQTASPIVLAGS
jgi:hypothetical protein